MCEDYPQETAIDYRRGLLLEAESAAFERHLQDCAKCREAVAEAESLLQLLDPRVVKPRPAAHSRVLREIRRESVRRRVAQPAIAGEGRRLRIGLGWAAAAALVFLAIGIWAVQSWVSNRPTILATLMTVSENVIVRRQGGEHRATAGMLLYRDDEIVAAGEGSAIVVLADTTRIEVGPQTTLALHTLKQQTGGELHLESGFVSIEAAHRPADRPLRISTPKATAQVLGTHFTLAATPRQTNVRVEQGPGAADPQPRWGLG